MRSILVAFMLVVAFVALAPASSGAHACWKPYATGNKGTLEILANGPSNSVPSVRITVTTSRPPTDVCAGIGWTNLCVWEQIAGTNNFACLKADPGAAAACWSGPVLDLSNRTARAGAGADCWAAWAPVAAAR